MARLLDVASVVTSNEPWKGRQVSMPGCGLVVQNSTVCGPDPTIVAGDADTNYDMGEVVPFAVIATLDRRVRCSDIDGEPIVKDALDAVKDRAIGAVLWSGLEDSTPTNVIDLHFNNADVRTVAAGASPLDSLALALQDYYDNTSGPDPVVHLGVTAGLKLAETLGSHSLFNELAVVVNPGYPTSGIAVSGPVTVYLDNDVQVFNTVDWVKNLADVQALQLAAVEFDLCLVTRVS